MIVDYPIKLASGFKQACSALVSSGQTSATEHVDVSKALEEETYRFKRRYNQSFGEYFKEEVSEQGS